MRTLINMRVTFFVTQLSQKKFETTTSLNSITHFGSISALDMDGEGGAMVSILHLFQILSL